MLQIRLLGQFDLVLEGKRVVIPSRSGQSLLAYLALSAGTLHRREKLAGLFWSDTSEEIARRNLRQQLWVIRKALAVPALKPASAGADYFRADEISVGFDPQADYWLDVAQLERPLGDAALDDLIQRAALYRGELLPGFYDDWVLLARERVESVFDSLMQVLVARLIEAQQWNGVLEWSEKWLSFGSAPEPAFRGLMLAHAARGDMGKVQGDYQRCVTALHEELGIEPSVETRALYEGLVKGAQIPARVLPAHPSATVTFLFADIQGSTRLLERLQEHYATVLHEHHEILLAAVKKWDGREMDTQGDAFFCTFGRAADAVACAVEAQRALYAHAWSQGEQVRVRMGVHTGEPLLAATGYIGMDVHRAARIGDAAYGGQVLLSQTTRDLVIHELPENVSLRDLGEHRLKDLKYPAEVYQLVIDGLPDDFPPLATPFTGAEPPTPGDPPFKGLEYFDVQDADLFFGREALTAQLVERIGAAGDGNGKIAANDGSHNLLVVVGASGSGKSSLVRAGLIPAIRQASGAWILEIITPTAHPLQALAAALTRDSESVTATATLMDDLAQDPRALQLYLARWTADGGPPATDRRPRSVAGEHVLLVVDQFEELFTLCRDEFERQAFIDNLVYAISSAPPALLTLVLTLRADFYAHLAQYLELRDAVAKQQEYIGPMTSEELRRAMEEPARRAHWEFEPGLVDLILRDVGDEPGALPLLSHALLETWKRRAGHTLTLKGYHDAGGVQGAIAHTADSTYQQLSPEQQQIARNIFLRLTELGEGTEDTRRRATIQELIPRPEDADKVRAVLNQLAAARLITLGQDTAEVAHEALIREWDTLREWLNQGREGLRLHRHLTEAAQEWEFLERDPGALYRGARLAQAREWAALNDYALNPQERAFLDASEAQEQHEARERAEQQQRELDSAKQIAEHAQTLAQAQQARADESSRANKRLRQRALFLVGALVLALLLAGLALFLGNQANRSALAAEVARDDARVQQRIANARELAANSLNNLTIDPQLSILLALQAIQATKPDKTILPEAQDALHRAVIASHVEAVLPQQDLSKPVTQRGFHDDSGTVYSPDGSRIATRMSGVFKIWDSKTYQELLNLPVSPDFGSIALAYSSDSTQVVTLDHDASANETLVKFFDANSGKLLRTVRLAEPWDNVMAAGFSRDLSRVVLAPYAGDANVWDLTTGKSAFSFLQSPGTLIADVRFSSDGKHILSNIILNDGVQVFDAATGKQEMLLCCHGDNARSASYSPDGKLIATGGNDAKIKIWDAETGKELNSLSAHTGPVRDLAWSPDAKRLASASDDHGVIVWDTETGKEIYELAGHTDWVEDVEFSPDGKQLVSSSEDKTVRVWDVGPSRELAAVDGPPKMYSYQHSADRMHLYTSWSPNGEYDELHGNFQIWEVNTLAPILTLAGGPDFPLGRLIAVSPDEKLGAFDNESDSEVMVWDLQKNQEVRTLSPGNQINWQPKFSPDGTHIAVPQDPDAAPEVSIWDVKTAQLIKTINLGDYGTSFLYSVAWSPDGRQVVTGWANGTTQVWDVNTGKQLADLPGHISYIMAIVYSPDGKLLATASRDATTIVYDATTYKEMYRLIGHTSDVLGLDFSPDGKYIATASQDGTAKVWDATDGKELASLYHSPEAVSSVMFTADSQHIITTSEDGAIRKYTLDPQELIELAVSRFIRTWRQDECQKYLHVTQCP